MKKKNLKTILGVIFIITFIIILLPPIANADYIDDIETTMKGKIKTPNDVGITGFGKVMKIILELIRYTGAGIALIMVIITGIKYIVSSASEKADYKKKLIPMAIGSVLLFAATEIIAIVGNMALSL